MNHLVELLGTGVRLDDEVSELDRRIRLIRDDLDDSEVTDILFDLFGILDRAKAETKGH